MNYNQAHGDKFEPLWKSCKEIGKGIGIGAVKEGVNQLDNWLTTDDSGTGNEPQPIQKNIKNKQHSQVTCNTCQCA